MASAPCTAREVRELVSDSLHRAKTGAYSRLTGGRAGWKVWNSHTFL